MWCIDGHDKFRDYGIHIYAAIDGCSRKVKWAYVGNSNRTQVSVAKQYLTVISQPDNVCPSHIRSDRGGEVLMLAEAQYSFFLLELGKEQERLINEGKLTPEQRKTIDEIAEDIPIRHCYWFETSTANIRIEGWWHRLIEGQTLSWLSYFKWLKNNGFYASDRVADCIILLFVFIPIIHKEISQYVLTHNEHRMRYQAERPNHIPGRPDKIYEGYPHKSNGYRPDPELLAELNASLEGYG
jgi:hypothetical protein